MESFRPFLIRLLAVLLFLQSGLAVAQCLRGMAPAQGVMVEICSAEGMRSIRLDAPGGAAAPDGQPAQIGGFCPACHSLPEFALPAPTRVAALAWFEAATAWHGAGAARLGPPARAGPYNGRAPPTG